MSEQAEASNPYVDLADAVERIGLGAFAKKCDVSYQAVQRWLRNNRVPANRCLVIEVASEGKVTRYGLRPDVFGDLPSAELSEAG